MNCNRKQLYNCLVVFLMALAPYTMGQVTPEISYNLPTALNGASLGLGEPGVAIDVLGNVIIAWMQTNSVTGEDFVYAARYDQITSTWTNPYQISTTSFYNVTQPNALKLAMDGLGNVIVAWITLTDVYAARYDSSMTWPNGWTRKNIYFQEVLLRRLSRLP